MNSSVRYARIWIGGLVLSTCLMWGGSQFFVDSARDYVWDEDLHEHVPRTGQHFQWRAEGWGTTLYNKHFIPVVDVAASESRSKIALWGDSQVEASQVADKDKPAQQVTRLWAKQNFDQSLVCAGVGRRGWSLVDIIDHLPKYQSFVKFDAHYILLSTLEDVMPDERKFVSKPSYLLRPDKEAVSGVRFRPLIAQGRLEFLLWAGHNVLLGPRGQPRKKLRFSVGPVAPRPAKTPEIATAATPIPADAWDFLLAELKKQSTAPLVFVYVPGVPWIHGGTIEFDNPEQSHLDAFSAKCAQHGIRFIDLSDEFARVVRLSGRFPRGFHNGIVSLGHLNELGHSLVAQAICADYRDQLVRVAQGEGVRNASARNASARNASVKNASVKKAMGHGSNSAKTAH